MFIFLHIIFIFSTTHKNEASFFRFAHVAIIGYFPALFATTPPTHFLKKSSFFQKTAWQIAKWVYIKPVITDKVMIPKWRGSSVGRAEDWKSSCHQFDPGPCHHFCFNSLIYNDLCIENTRKNRVFFRFKFSVWRIWRTGERHKAAKILRFALSEDTAFMLKIGWFFAFQVKKK